MTVSSSPHNVGPIVNSIGAQDRVMNSPGRQECWREWLISASLVFIIFFSPLVDGGTTQFPVLLIRLVLIGAASLWLIQQMRGGSIWILKNSIILPVMLFLIWAGLSLFRSPYKSASSQWFLSLLSYAILLLLAVKYTQTQRHKRGIVALLLGMGVMEGVLGIVQYVWLGETRAKGTFFNPNFFAAYEGSILLLSLGLAVCLPRHEEPPYLSILLWMSVTLAGAAFVLAQSRGALAALVVVLCILGVLRFGKVAVAVLLACIVFGAIVPNPLRERISEASSQDPYAYTRLDIWKNSLERFAEHPLGIGLGMYKYGSFQDRFPTGDHIIRYKKRAESAHNEYLQMGVELGVVGLVIFLAGVGIWLREAWLTWQIRRESSEEGLIIGLIGVVLMLLVHAGGDSVFHEPALLVVLVVAAAILHNMYGEIHPTLLQWKQVPIAYNRARVGLVLAGGLALTVLCVQPAAGWYVHELGKHEAGQGRIDKALERYIQATAIDPGATGYHDSVSRTAMQLYERSNDPKWLMVASEEESLARDLNRLDGRFPYRLGTIYSLMAKQPEFGKQRAELLNNALMAYAEAIQADPYTPFSYYELAKLLLIQGQRDKALALLRTAMDYEPNYLPARALLAETSLNAGLPGDYEQELAVIKTISAQYRYQVRDDIERQFVDVDLHPLGHAIAMESRK